MQSATFAVVQMGKFPKRTTCLHPATAAGFRHRFRNLETRKARKVLAERVITQLVTAGWFVPCIASEADASEDDVMAWWCGSAVPPSAKLSILLELVRPD
jgi:hypothetical protein